VRRTRDGLIVSLNTGTEFGPPREWPVYAAGGGELPAAELPPLEKESGKSSSHGLTVYAGTGAQGEKVSAGMALGLTWQRGWSKAVTGFADVDGDGRTDILEEGEESYLKNTGSSFVKTMIRSDPGLPGSSERLEKEEVDGFDTAYFQQTPFRAWKAPRRGRVRVAQRLSARPDAENPAERNLSADGVKARLYAGAAEEAVQTLVIAGMHPADVEDAVSLQVEEGQYLYFVPDAGFDTRNDFIDWNIRIAYEEAAYFSGMSRIVDFYPLLDITAEQYDAYYASHRDLANVYDPVDNGSSPPERYHRASDWRASLPNIRDDLIDLGRFLPRRIYPDHFQLLVDACEATVSLIELQNHEALFSAYCYDAMRDEYFITEMHSDQSRETIFSLIANVPAADRLAMTRYAPHSPDRRASRSRERETERASGSTPLRSRTIRARTRAPDSWAAAVPTSWSTRWSDRIGSWQWAERRIPPGPAPSSRRGLFQAMASPSPNISLP